ncbi:cobalamin biosynthesis protein [Thermoplasma sp.]|uniref:cobalamin biosynthesis protein n=1 Tax=Thermoplasma sp. TaxID=1973142 RepID=UPI002638D1B5|nr:cobalamin biosynthesis protein [Thermoplasma sp.]
MNNLIIMIIVLIGAIAIDIIFGEPKEYIHPVVFSGRVSKRIEGYFRRNDNRILAGSIFAISVIIITAIPYFLAIYLSSFVVVIYVIVSMVVLKTTFSISSMGDHIRLIVESLKNGNINDARVYLSRVVRRDTTNLNENEISSAAIETIAEGLVDGYMTPLFFFIFLGIPGAFIARIINTLDSMYGYKDRQNFEFGRFSAFMDTVINYIPARLSWFFIGFSADVLNYRHKIISPLKYVRRFDSVNAGWPISTIACALNLRLEKKGSYIVNDDGYEPSVKDIERTMRVFYVAVYSYTIIFVLPLLVAMAFIL